MKETNASTYSALGLTLLGTTCCALPLTLVALGAGGAVASMASSLPWLIGISQYKGWTFTLTALALGYARWRVHSVESCDIADAARLRWQSRALWAATALFGLSVFAAYALLPLVQWWEQAAGV